MFQIFEQVIAHFSNGLHNFETQGAKINKVKVPFIDKLSGLAIVKILDGGTHSTLLIKLKFTHNVAILDIVNNGTETRIFRPEEMLGIVNMRLLGYCKIKQGIQQQNLSKY